MRLSKLLLTLLFVTSVSAYSITANADEKRMAGTKSQEEIKKTSEVYKQLKLFGDVFEKTREKYVEEVTDKELIEAAIDGMLVNLDPHSSYLNEEDFKNMQIQTRGEFGGLGIEVTMENGFVKVVSPIDDTPAFRAGMKSGDYVTHLDDEPVMGLSLSEAVEKMRGRVGTTLKLTVRREGESEALEINITRDIITINPVKNRQIGDDIAYVRVTSFNQNTDRAVKDVIKKMKKDMNDNMVGLILDLRNNPGGLLDQAISVSNLFLEKGEIVSTRGRDENDAKRDNATSGDILEGKPIIVLINGGSASASEIVAGALQDHKRGILLGTKSFGKGSVQTVIPLSGHGAMRLTTARYYTPSGRSIQAKGIDPDIVVEQAKIETVKEKSFHESDYRDALDKKNSDKKSDGKEEDSSAKDEKYDYQLERAKDLIRGLSLYRQNAN